MTAAIPVAVIIPAYNAAATLDQTLLSARGQTHRALEIIVIDDGSTDDTRAIAAAHAARDARIRIVVQPNLGVAAARNRGVAEASAEFVAPLDADDLWSADKIERQLALLVGGGAAVALAYAWFALIDADDRIILHDPPRLDQGDVLLAMCRRNLVGNGSGALIRKAAILEAGGYDTGLRAADAEGCEDYGLYFAIAERHRFVVVPAYLVGYRSTPANMSSHGMRMLRSRDICLAAIASRRPELAPALRAGRARLIRFLLARALREHNGRATWRLFAQLCRCGPRHLSAELWDAALQRSRRAVAAMLADTGSQRFEAPGASSPSVRRMSGRLSEVQDVADCTVRQSDLSPI